MKPTLQSLLDRYLAARDAIRTTFRMESEYLYPVCASLFASADKAVDPERLQDCKRMMKDSTGIFSSFRGNVQLPLVCMLALDDDPQAMWEHTQDNFATLKEHFWSSEFLALAAALLADRSAEEVASLAERAKSLYQRMKREHPFLTGQEDSVFAVLLAESPRTDEELIADMEACYRLLDKRFPKGNGLQSASHVLALMDGAPEDKAGRMIALFDAIRAAGGKYGKELELSALATLLAGQTPIEALVADLMDANAFLAGQKGYKGLFGFAQRTRLMHAAMLVSVHNAKEQTERLSDAAEPSALVHAAAQQAAIATIIAQQVAMCAIIVSTTASHAASSAH